MRALCLVERNETYTLAIHLPKRMGNYNDGTFVETLPTITDATPLQDPIAGSTRVTITRTNLDIGNNAVMGFTGITTHTMHCHVSVYFSLAFYCGRNVFMQFIVRVVCHKQRHYMQYYYFN